MSLINCLACQRTDSKREHGHHGHDIYRNFSSCCIKKVERSWSGNLAPPSPPPYEQIRNASKNRKKNCRRLHSTGAVYDGADEPRLVRSAGMRRDWSFEDLAQRNDHIVIRKSGRLS
ncbi:hypothetical protein Dsin_030311 [Dipteronia sinensis]|uniref:Uncharacterized protein n=1 Tax=Dipteronia sinensis TaxID=43782 RepID=A0AAD9ZJA6_9ROSI|nr:hypothetical protein Dsin_030311 [Dipteronia sinensis]